MSKIKYCIWDVGQTIYPYSLNPLNEFCLKNSKNKQALREKSGVKGFDYKPLMRGEITFSEFCRELCQYAEIDYNKDIENKIDIKLHDGVGNIYPETIKAMKFLAANKVKNCILSNALPNLKETAGGLVEKDKAFTSYELGLLKPDPQIFQTVLHKLDARPQEVIFVDDKPQNVMSAQSLGICGIVYDKSAVYDDIRHVIKSDMSHLINQTKSNSRS